MIIFGLLGFALCLVAFFGFGIAGLLAYQGYESQSWELAPSKYKVEAEPARIQRPDKPDEKRYKPVLKYIYVVDGEKYRGTRIAFGTVDFESHLSENDAILSLGSQIDTDEGLSVYYDPANPKKSVMQPGIQVRALGVLAGGAFLLLLIGVGFISIGI